MIVNMIFLFEWEKGETDDFETHVAFAWLQKRNENVCIVRESNPGRPRGRRAFYHWTNDANLLKSLPAKFKKLLCCLSANTWCSSTNFHVVNNTEHKALTWLSILLFAINIFHNSPFPNFRKDFSSVPHEFRNQAIKQHFISLLSWTQMALASYHMSIDLFGSSQMFDRIFLVVIVFIWFITSKLFHWYVTS